MEIQLVEDLWFEDGSIVIQAELSLFKVSSKLLARRSGFFRDLVSLPVSEKAEESQEFYEGCPLVKLQDSAEEVEVFLKSIFDLAFFEPSPSKTRADIVLAILRLSHKYDVPPLRKRALGHFTTVSPTCPSEYASAGENPNTFELSLHQTFQAVSIARETESLWLLPSLFYTISTECNIPAFLEESAMWPDQDRTTCLMLRQSFLSASMAGLRHVFAPAATTSCCKYSSDCGPTRHAWLAWGISALSHIPHQPLVFWDIKHWEKYLGQVCKECGKEARKKILETKEKIWNDIPGQIGIQDWTVLKQMKTEALTAPVASLAITPSVNSLSLGSSRRSSTSGNA